MKVKLGPIALVYNGSGTFVEKDDAAHRFVVDAKGKDKRGNGTAGAKVTLSMDSSASGGTDVEVLTDLAVTGKPAQFGRGVMQDVSDKLLGQFVACLEQRLGPSAAEAPIVPDEVAGASGVSTAGTSGTIPEAEPDTPVTPPPCRRLTPTRGRPRRRRWPTWSPSPHARLPRHVSPPTPPPSASPARADDAINLGSTVLPILLKTYWKQGLGLLVVIALIVVLIVAL